MWQTVFRDDIPQLRRKVTLLRAIEQRFVAMIAEHPLRGIENELSRVHSAQPQPTRDHAAQYFARTAANRERRHVQQRLRQRGAKPVVVADVRRGEPQ